MFCRMRIYASVRENLPLFHDFFRTHLLPVQLRHGARLIGRWETDDGRVVAVWEYDDRAAFERIEAAVRSDPDSRKAQQHRAQLPPLITALSERASFSAHTAQNATQLELIFVRRIAGWCPGRQPGGIASVPALATP